MATYQFVGYYHTTNIDTVRKAVARDIIGARRIAISMIEKSRCDRVEIYKTPVDVELNDYTNPNWFGVNPNWVGTVWMRPTKGVYTFESDAPNSILINKDGRKMLSSKRVTPSNPMELLDKAFAESKKRIKM